MKYLMLGYNIFCRNILLNLFLIAQLLIALVLVNISIGHINSYSYMTDIFSNIADHKGVYYMPASQRHWYHQNELGLYRDPVFDELKGLKTISSQYTAAFEIGNRLYDARAFDDYMLSYLQLPLDEGEWLTAFGHEEEFVPIVVSSETTGLQLGHTVPALLRHLDKDLELVLIEVELKVVGVLGSPPLTIRYGRGGTDVTSNDIFDFYDEDYYGVPLIIFARDALGEALNSTQRSQLVFFEDDISDSDFTANMDILANHGWVQPIDVMYKLGKQEMRDEFMIVLPFILCAFLISLIGLGSLNILNTFRHTREFAIYYLCGSRWKNCFYICLSYMLILSFLTLTLLSIAFYWFTSSGMAAEMGVHYTVTNIVVTTGVLVFVLFFSLVTPYFILKRTYPIEIIRQYHS